MVGTSRRILDRRREESVALTDAHTGILAEPVLWGRKSRTSPGAAVTVTPYECSIRPVSARLVQPSGRRQAGRPGEEGCGANHDPTPQPMLSALRPTECRSPMRTRPSGRPGNPGKALE